MSVRRDTTNRLTLCRTCGTCGRSIVTTADTPWVRQVERDGKKQATTYFCSERCFAASYKHIRLRLPAPEAEAVAGGGGSMGLTGADLARLGPAAQKQVLEKLGQQQEKERKYHNLPTVVNGIHFDSRKEANRYIELMSLQSAGKIRKLKLQEQFTLQESYVTDTGERVRAIRYVADFTYERPTEPDCTGTVHWLPVVEDVKSRGTRTAKYKMKKKLMRERRGLTITEV